MNDKYCRKIKCKNYRLLSDGFWSWAYCLKNSTEVKKIERCEEINEAN
jgi:hypothetical protein